MTSTHGVLGAEKQHSQASQASLDRPHRCAFNLKYLVEPVQVHQGEGAHVLGVSVVPHAAVRRG